MIKKEVNENGSKEEKSVQESVVKQDMIFTSVEKVKEYVYREAV